MQDPSAERPKIRSTKFKMTEDERHVYASRVGTSPLVITNLDQITRRGKGFARRHRTTLLAK